MNPVSFYSAPKGTSLDEVIRALTQRVEASIAEPN